MNFYNYLYYWLHRAGKILSFRSNRKKGSDERGLVAAIWLLVILEGMLIISVIDELEGVCNTEIIPKQFYPTTIVISLILMNLIYFLYGGRKDRIVKYYNEKYKKYERIYMHKIFVSIFVAVTIVAPGCWAKFTREKKILKSNELEKIISSDHKNFKKYFIEYYKRNENTVYMAFKHSSSTYLEYYKYDEYYEKGVDDCLSIVFKNRAFPPDEYLEKVGLRGRIYEVDGKKYGNFTNVPKNKIIGYWDIKTGSYPPERFYPNPEFKRD